MTSFDRRRRSDACDGDIALLIARRIRRRRRPQRSRVAFFALAAAAAVVAGIGLLAAGGANAILAADCSLRALRPIRLGSDSFVFAGPGVGLGSVPSLVHRQPVPLSHVSLWVRKATVAIEDRRFYQHGGIDYLAIVRAAVADLGAGRIVQGASTIEQELARTRYLGDDQRTLAWKMKQACLAVKIAARWSRPQILDAYLNQVYYGDFAYGVEAASKTYFSRRAGRLTLDQAALLAGLPQAPSQYDPLLHPGAARSRRNEVLRALFVQGALSRARYRNASAGPLGLRPGSFFTRLTDPSFVGFVARQLASQFGSRLVRRGGLQITTTLDQRLQQAARSSIENVLHTPGDPAAALVAIDPRNGAIRAMAAYQPGRTLQLNLAASAHRQAGSAFKPFVLATALEHGFTLGSSFVGPASYLVPDPRCNTGNQPWLVNNYGGESFGGISLLTATANSVNTVFAQLVDQVGPTNVVALAHRVGIVSPLQGVCSITLGSQAVTPLEMTDAYATLAEGGIQHPAQAIGLVRNRRGAVIDRIRTRGARALPASVAAEVTQALQAVVQYGTGTAARLPVPTAGKTGTADHEEDAWFCGFVPQLATCVWMGYPAGEIPMHNIEGVPVVVGGTLPAEIWHSFMTHASGLPAPSNG